MVEEELTEEEKQDEAAEATEFSNDQLVRAQVVEIEDDMPDELKKQLQQFNEMSQMLNNSLDNPVEPEPMDEDEENDEDGDEVSESSGTTQTYTEDKNVEYSDIF